MKFSLIFSNFANTLLFCLFCISCSSYDRNDYQIVVNVKEFEVKHSQDIFDRKPETFIRIATETRSKDSDIYHDYKVNFVEKGEALSFGLDGVALDHKIKFSVKLYDHDYDVLGLIFLDNDLESEGYIGGSEIEIKIPTSTYQSEITVDNDEVHLVFTYSITYIED